MSTLIAASLSGQHLRVRDQLPRQLAEVLSIALIADPFGLRTEATFYKVSTSEIWKCKLDDDGQIPGWFLAKLAIEV